MKKTYINPEMITVHIASKMMIAVSGPGLKDKIADEGYGMDVKENVIPDIDIWDNEW